jgi:hypothetical protein
LLSKTVFKMATSQMAHKVEQAIGYDNNAITAQDVSNPALDPEEYGDPNIRMKALAWMGKNKVQISKPARVIARHSFTNTDS